MTAKITTRKAKTTTVETTTTTVETTTTTVETTTTTVETTIAMTTKSRMKHQTRRTKKLAKDDFYSAKELSKVVVSEPIRKKRSLQTAMDMALQDLILSPMRKIQVDLCTTPAIMMTETIQLKITPNLRDASRTS